MPVQMQDIPSTGRLFTCDNCGYSTRRQILPGDMPWEIASARFVGWRFAGPLTEPTATYCPVCAGTDPDYWSHDSTVVESWRVRCKTCGWEWDDEYDEGALNGKDAHAVAQRHVCAPQLEIAAPIDGTWRPIWELTSAGTWFVLPAPTPEATNA